MLQMAEKQQSGYQWWYTAMTQWHKELTYLPQVDRCLDHNVLRIGFVGNVITVNKRRIISDKRRDTMFAIISVVSLSFYYL